jgi:hypothetical protein
MRARHRHFSYKAAGASLALDTRYIHGVADNATVETWSDRSGNARDATQSNGSARATYKTAIQGGNGVLRFDGNDRYLSSFVTGTEYSVYCVYKRTGSNTNAFSNATFVVAAGIINTTSASGRRFQLAYSDANGGTFANTSNTSAEMTIARNDNWNLHSVTAPIGSGTARYFVNEGNEQTADVSGLAGVTSGTVILRVGSTSWVNTFDFNGDMGLVATYQTAHSASLRRRLNHHAAYSFKISCN